MTPALAGVFYLAVLLIVAGAAVYLFRTRPKEVSYPTGRTSDGSSAGDLEKYIAQLASSATGSCLVIELASTRDTLLVTKDGFGINLQFDRKSRIEDFVPKLQELASNEGLTLIRPMLGFPEVTIPQSTVSPGPIAHRLFCAIYDAKNEDAVNFDLVLEDRQQPDGRSSP